METKPIQHYAWLPLAAASALTALMFGLLASFSITQLAQAQNEPFISGVSIAPSDTSATISWNTDIGSMSQVVYGTSSSYSATSTLNSGLTTTHSAQLTGLNPGTTYHLQVLSADSSGNNVGRSADQTFTTTSTANPIYTTSGNASVNLSSTGGSPGTNITISGNGFGPSESIALSFGGTSMGSTVTDTTGHFSMTLNVPNLTNGNATVSASGATSGKLASATFAVGGSSTSGTGTGAIIPSNELAALQTQVTLLQNQVATLQQQVASLMNQGSSSSGTTGATGGTGTTADVVSTYGQLYTGTLSGLDGTSFTLTTSDGTTYTVNVASDTTIWNNAKSAVPLSSFSNGDAVRLNGFLSGNSIAANVVRDTSI